MTVTVVVLVLAVVVFVWNKVPVGLVAIGVTLALYGTGVVSLEQAFGGFGDPVIIFIAALFVVSDGLEASGVTSWAGQQLVDRAHGSRTRLVVLLMALVAVVTALISVNGAVAALLPMVVVTAVRLRLSPSQFLIPLAFGAHAGSLLVLTGTPVNVLVSELAVGAGEEPFGFFSFTLVGLPLVLGTMLVVVLLGPRLLPNRAPTALPRDLSGHARLLAEQYALDDRALLGSDTGVTEVVVSPRSALIGAEAFPGMVTESGDLVIAAIQRGGEQVGPTTLQAGDALLLQGTWEALDRTTTDPDVTVVDPPQLLRRQAAPMGGRAKVAIGIVLGMVLLLATGAVPASVAALLAACAMVLLRVMTVSEAHRAISWTTLILVGGMIPLSVAIQSTGLADAMARGLVDVVGTDQPHLLLLGIVVVTVILGQLISNMATALVIGPIAVAVAVDTGLSPLPMLMGVTVAAAAAFLTPVATPANTMVLGPGGYRFGDYWRLGLPLTLLFVLVATFLVPVFWPF
ncbi:SLC13 family permease [Sanguibacter keddieii]|uniref:SLC13 family permease n=1 Tax=Sanguibacter keddieii TaxID=60920 RepID=UPI0005A70577|nr:SLC13 family permease [Sanguibacter keddieii]